MNENTFDFIIIGAGSAGAVLANRLSADGTFSVCLLEAGPEDTTSMIKIPGAFSYFMFSKKYNWNYDAKIDPSIRHGQPMYVPRGKTLGGSSATNAMLYVRGQPQDYDHWQALGNSGWSYNDMLPYFIKSETNERGASQFHGNNGPLQVTDRPNYYPISEVFLEGAQQAGYPLNNDFNGESQEGVGYYQCTIKDGQRCGVSRAYLTPARARSNVTVLTQALVSRIVIKGGVAVGATFSHQGKTKNISARNEVLLCGGAINSPQILMLSGVGDKEELASHNIDCKLHLPGVGKNLQEHVDACILVNSKKRDGFTSSIGGLLSMMPDTINYLLNKKGKLANSILEAGGFLKTQPEMTRPDVQLHMVPLLFDDNGRDLKLMRGHGYSCHVCVLRPKSTGSVSLRSANPNDKAVIDFNFFSHPDDQKVLVDGLKQVREIMATPAFDGHRAEELYPGSDVISDEEIFIKAKGRLGTVYHPVGTCKMGDDEMAVVDSSLKVHSIAKLRVVDASIMPTLVSGNTNAPTIAIAEKAADMILASH